MRNPVALFMNDLTPLIERARELLRAAQRVTAFTGAGISTDSGIPDFRGPNGLWTKNPLAEKTSTLSYYLNDPEVRKIAWQNRARNLAWTAEPNVGHKALVQLQQRGVLRAVATQNVDGLHQKAGNHSEIVHELHGTMHVAVCWDCKDTHPMRAAVERVLAGDADPKCLLCGGILKSDTILFEESLKQDVIEAALLAADECDVLLVVGSSLRVYPAANIVPRAKANGAHVIIVNGQPTDMDRYADIVINGDIGTVLPQIVE
ncbi:MAG: NAD-dependent deacetylase [Actinomycetota bacterium]